MAATSANWTGRRPTRKRWRGFSPTTPRSSQRRLLMVDALVRAQSPETTRHRAFGPSRLIGFLANSRELTLIVLIALLSVTMAVVYPDNFATWYNFSAVLLNAAQTGILVTGMMLLMIAGMFDLSIGSTLAFSGVVA